MLFYDKILPVKNEREKMENKTQTKEVPVQQCGLYEEDLKKMDMEELKISTKKTKFSSLKRFFSKQKER